jgi:hypothetical protein
MRSENRDSNDSDEYSAALKKQEDEDRQDSDDSDEELSRGDVGGGCSRRLQEIRAFSLEWSRA